MTPPVPKVPDAVWDSIIAHTDSEFEREVGGILVGDLCDDYAEVEAALPALKAEGARASVTFTHEVWEEALSRIDREYPSSRIVGWYHSHPGFGIFLSEYDRFIQKNFFPHPGMVALVVDPHAQERGWFGWNDGEIVRLDESPAPEPVATTRQRRRWVIATAAAAALITAAGAMWMSRDAPIADVKPAVSAPVKPKSDVTRPPLDPVPSSKRHVWPRSSSWHRGLSVR